MDYERQDTDYDVDFVDNPIFDTDQPEPDRNVFYYFLEFKFYHSQQVSAYWESKLSQYKVIDP